MPDSDVSPRRWLILLHQLPPKPDYLRVKIRRRLHRLGAALIKNSVYALPDSEEALEDLTWLAQEIRSEGGEAVLATAAFVSGITDQEVEGMLAANSPDGPSTDRAAGQRLVEPGTTWVTREGIRVDRIASAWLIRRFIDTQAHFKFVPARGYRPADGELRFDMFEAEYTHVGERCTFETLLGRFQLEQPALKAISEIVHDVDCKDAMFQRPETPGVAALIDSIVQAHSTDTARLEHGLSLFDGLLGHFERSRP